MRLRARFPSQSGKDRESGFTLIEMCVVMAIFSAVLAIVVVGAQRMMRTSRLIGVTNTLVGDLRTARQLSTTQGRNYQIVFRSGGYQLYRTSPVDTVLRRNYPSGVTATATDTATFFAWGLTDPITVTINGASGTKTLQLSANGNITK